MVKATIHERHSRRSAAQAQLREEARRDTLEALRCLETVYDRFTDGSSSERAATSANPRSSAEAVAVKSTANSQTFMLNYIDAVAFKRIRQI